MYLNRRVLKSLRTKETSLFFKPQAAITSAGEEGAVYNPESEKPHVRNKNDSNLE